MHDLRERAHGHTNTYCTVSIDGSEKFETGVVYDSERPQWTFDQPRILYVSLAPCKHTLTRFVVADL